jgi:large subunit ribosomal protein L6
VSRIGRMPIPIPKGVTVKIEDGNLVTVKGPKGELARTMVMEMSIQLKDDQVVITRPSDDRRVKALHGLTRALLANMVTGVVTGYRRELQIEGVGYRAELQGKNLVISVGYSHTVTMEPPAGITFDVDKPGRIVGVTGVDKEMVGEVAARIRRVRPPEPYMGKGIRYVGEHVRTKAGKAGKVGKGAK